MAATHVLVALMTAAATTSGFLAPQLAPAMHLPPLRSMAEDDGDWPSDSAEDAAPDVIDVPRVEDRESLKKELLLLYRVGGSHTQVTITLMLFNVLTLFSSCPSFNHLLQSLCNLPTQHRARHPTPARTQA